MFDALLKSKFYSKCKSAIKMTKTRLAIIKRKRNAMQKYLKNDIVDLLKNGLDTNAYGRAEGFWNELNLSCCYDMVKQYCTNISSHLASMDKQRECPEECREAASSLMFAAARFSDLPELRELRTVFTERFGNSIEHCVDKEFVHKLKSTPPTKDMKLQLMQDIALESGIEWNTKTLELKLYKSPTAPAPDGMNGKTNSPKLVDNADKNLDNNGVERKHEAHVKYTAYERKGVKDKGHTCAETENIVPIKDIHVDHIDRKVQQSEPFITSASEEENDDKKPFYYKPIRPPYSKYKISITSTAADVSPTGADAEGLEDKQRSSQTGKSDDIQQDDPIGNSKPKPKSVRRRNQKTFQDKDKVEKCGDVGPENGGSLNDPKGINEGGGNEGRQQPRIRNDRQNDQRDEEERTMDKLLMHYSRKKLPHDTGESEVVLKPSAQPAAINTLKETKDRRRDGPPIRVASLPSESSPTEATRLRARASSFQPEILNSNGHIHPKLPDYDDFVARLAALRANLN